MPEFNRFDIVEAWYVFLCQWHDGRGRGWASYGRLSRLLGYFKPGSHLNNEDDLTENGTLIYEKLCERLYPDLAHLREQLDVALAFAEETPGHDPLYWTGAFPCYPARFKPKDWEKRNPPFEHIWDDFLSALARNGLVKRLEEARLLPIADLLVASSVSEA